MEEEVAKTEFCSNCQRDIPAANFVMHVTHCQRNLTLCKLCGEPVPTSQQEEHFDEYHAKIKCKCGQLLEKMDLEEHEDKACPSRLVDCQYCELQLPFSELTSHVEYCGSRTDKCDICDRFIQKKDFEAHVDSGCQYPVKEEKKKLPPKVPQAGDFGSEMPVGMLHAMGLMDSTENWSDEEKFFPFVPGMREFQQIINSGLGVPPFSGASYFADGFTPDTRMDDRDVISRGARQNRGTPKVKFDEDRFQYFEDVDRNDMQQTEDDEMLAAAYQADEFDSGNGADGTPSGMSDEHFQNMQPSLMSDSENAAGTTKLPCEFCGDLLPMDVLILHQSGCQLRSLDSLRGGASNVPPMNSYRHNLPPKNNSAVARHIREFHEDQTELESEEREDLDITFLPCEFCQELFPSDNLIVHQAVCDASPASLPPPVVYNGVEPGPILNNARPSVRNGSLGRPSRPVYESKKIPTPVKDFIPRELEDSSSDLDFTPMENGHEPDEYSDRFGQRGGAVMNNELQRRERNTADDRLRGQTMLRNNDLDDRRSSKDIPRVKNRTIDPPRKTELSYGLNGTAHRAPTVKPTEEGVYRKNLSIGAKSRPGQDTTKPFRLPQTNDSRVKPQQSSLKDSSERFKRELPVQKAMEGRKLEARSSKPSAVRSTSKPKLPDPPLAINRVTDSASQSISSNPRRNPPTVTSEVGRSNRGRARQQSGSTVESRSTNSHVRKTTKKIV